VQQLPAKPMPPFGDHHNLGIEALLRGFWAARRLVSTAGQGFFGTAGRTVVRGYWLRRPNRGARHLNRLHLTAQETTLLSPRP
jgi:hypothetical protein